MPVKNCKETESLSTSERSFNSLTLFLDFTLTSNTFFTYRRTSGGGGEGVNNHPSRVSDLLVNVHDTKRISQVFLVKSLYLRPLVSDHLCRSLMPEFRLCALS